MSKPVPIPKAVCVPGFIPHASTFRIDECIGKRNPEVNQNFGVQCRKMFLCYTLKKCKPGDCGLEYIKYDKFITDQMVLSTVYLTKRAHKREIL